jgi:hypothetical protein
MAYFAKYRWRRNYEYGRNQWNNDELTAIQGIMQAVRIEKEDKSIEAIKVGPVDVGQGYKAWMDRFKNKLRSTIGAADVPISYVIRADVPISYVIRDDDPPFNLDPNDIGDPEKDEYLLRHDGPEYAQDNKMVYNFLYTACNHPEIKSTHDTLTWIKDYRISQDGRAAYQAFISHFDGTGPTSTRIAEARAMIASLHTGGRSNQCVSIPLHQN